jgi:hypothetical protein
MSTGIGKTQRAILDELNSTQDGHLSVVQLASRLSRSPRQIRRAVHSLADRALVVLTKQGDGWSGAGQYGPLRPRGLARYEELPVAETRHTILVQPNHDGTFAVERIATEYVHAGTPNGVSLFAWLPQAHRARQELARQWK